MGSCPAQLPLSLCGTPSQRCSPERLHPALEAAMHQVRHSLLGCYRQVARPQARQLLGALCKAILRAGRAASQPVCCQPAC